MAMSCSRTATCLSTRALPRLHLASVCIRQFHITIPTSDHKTHMQQSQKIKMKERKEQREEEARLKKAMPPKAQQPEEPLPKKTDHKVFQHYNPEAKFVLTYDLEVRHLLYSERHVGEVYSFPEPIIDQLHALGMFNPKQGFQYMRKPICMIRNNTGLVARQLLAKEVGHLGTKNRRVVVAGKPGTGKSFILLQMAAMALMQRYVVFAVPRGMDLVDNRTAYSLDPKTMRYKQTDYMANMISRTRKACFSVLQNHTTNNRVRIGREVFPEGTPLLNILEAGEVHPSSSQDAFEIFLLEMARPNRPPMLFLFDNISAISVPSLIRSEERPHNFVHPHRLWIPFFFTCLLNGTLNHPNAAVVAATSGFPNARTLEIALGQATQKPYEPIDRRIPHSVDGATVILAGNQFTPEEAMGISSYYKDAGLLKTVDRFDGLSKSVGDEEYYYPESGFWVYNPDKSQESTKERSPLDFKREGKMNRQIVANYIAKGGIVGKEDPTDFEATMERLALGGGTARGFWKACTRMSHH